MALSAHLALLALAPVTAPAAAGVIGTAGCAAGLLGASLRWVTFGVLALFGNEKNALTDAVSRSVALRPGAHAPRDNSCELAPLPFVLRILPEFMVVWAIVSLVGQEMLWRRIGRHANLRLDHLASTGRGCR
jgi:hypothetical protein